MKPISQMTREEKLQEIVEYNPCRVERSAVLRYLLAVRRNDTEQIAYFESFGKSVRHIILLSLIHISEPTRTNRLFREFWQECTTYHTQCTHV